MKSAEAYKLPTMHDSVRPATSWGIIYPVIREGQCAPSKNGMAFDHYGLLGLAQDWYPVLESERGADASVAGSVVVGVAVVVDVADVRGIRPVRRQLPPVAARTTNQQISAHCL